MRTLDELTNSAVTLRRGLLEQHKDPFAHCFCVSPEEWCLIMSQPFANGTVNHRDQRFCGLRLQEVTPERRTGDA